MYLAYKSILVGAALSCKETYFMTCNEVKGMVSEIPRLFFRYYIDYIMGREDGLHFSASQVSGSSRSYHVFKIFCWYQELLKLVFVYIKMIPEVQGRAFACVVSPGCSFVLYLLDFVGCSTAPAPVELQDWSVSATNWWSDFAVVISKCCELLVLCRKESTILLHRWLNSLEKCEDWVGLWSEFISVGFTHGRLDVGRNSWCT